MSDTITGSSTIFNITPRLVVEKDVVIPKRMRVQEIFRLFATLPTCANSGSVYLQLNECFVSVEKLAKQHHANVDVMPSNEKEIASMNINYPTAQALDNKSITFEMHQRGDLLLVSDSGAVAVYRFVDPFLFEGNVLFLADHMPKYSKYNDQGCDIFGIKII